MRPLRIFLGTEMTAECEECHARVDIVRGGVCTSCRRVLCQQHLFGSWVRRMMFDFGGQPVCVRCRTTQAPREAGR